MCFNCYQEYGSPAIDTPQVRHAAACIAKVYDEVSDVGGNLHCAIDDWNLDDLEYILEYDLEPQERECYDSLAALTVDERASALGLFDGFWGESMVEPFGQCSGPRAGPPEHDIVRALSKPQIELSPGGIYVVSNN